jgi:hypothetical protein
MAGTVDTIENIVDMAGEILDHVELGKDLDSEYKKKLDMIHTLIKEIHEEVSEDEEEGKDMEDKEDMSEGTYSSPATVKYADSLAMKSAKKEYKSFTARRGGTGVDDPEPMLPNADANKFKSNTPVFSKRAPKKTFRTESLAGLAPPYDEVTRMDVLTGRGVLKKVNGKHVVNKAVSYMKKMKNEENDPCWSNYKMVGMKTKNGKKVPNCVPEDKTDK